MLNIINDIMTSEWNAHWEMILARGLRLHNSTEFRLGTKIQAKKPDVGRDQHLAAKQNILQKSLHDKSVAQKWQISFRQLHE